MWSIFAPAITGMSGYRNRRLTLPEFSQGMSRSIDPITKDKAGYGPRAAPRTHRLDESAAGHSLPGWSPREPASASPAALIMPLFGWIRYAFSVNGNTSLLSWPRLRGPLQPVPTLSCSQKTHLGSAGQTPSKLGACQRAVSAAEPAESPIDRGHDDHVQHGRAEKAAQNHQGQRSMNLTAGFAQPQGDRYQRQSG